MNAKHGTQIDWTHLDRYRGETWNPITGCTKVSAGCANCYAERLINTRQSVNPKSVRYGHKFNEVMFHAERLDRPLSWEKPRAIFVNSLSDLFHEDVSFEQIAAIFGVMAATPHHRYFVVTKRPERMLAFFEWLPGYLGSGNVPNDVLDRLASAILDDHGNNWPLPNVAFLVSVEDQKSANERIPLLLQAKANGWIKYAGVSAEPLLGEVDLRSSGGYDAIIGGKAGDPVLPFAPLDWVIVGGESGPNARPMHPDWVRSIRDQCADAEVPFWFKQWGEWVPPMLDFEYKWERMTDEFYTGPPIQEYLDRIITSPPFTLQNGVGVDLSMLHPWYINECVWSKWEPNHGENTMWFRCGKKSAGDLLDGKRHKGPIKGFGEVKS